MAHVYLCHKCVTGRHTEEEGTAPRSVFFFFFWSTVFQLLQVNKPYQPYELKYMLDSCLETICYPPIRSLIKTYTFLYSLDFCIPPVCSVVLFFFFFFNRQTAQTFSIQSSACMLSPKQQKNVVIAKTRCTQQVVPQRPCF